MNALNVIIEEPLPLNQDYRALKEAGLAFIQLNSGYEWTNLNDVDPGVTILEQVCYALTELGYCNDFSVADILTSADGTLEVKDQFYLPEEILTTAPVTLTDYRKYLIDGINGISNALIVAIQPSVSNESGTYQVYLQPDCLLSTTEKEMLCTTAYIHLNKCRNLGELFLQPLCLIDDPHTIAGQIEIDDETVLNRVLIQIQQQIQHTIFPQVKPVGYDTLRAKGMSTSDIFNGPLLQNGWIPSSTLGEKKDQLQLIELQQVILDVPGVIKITGLIFDKQASAEEIYTTSEKLLRIDLPTSLTNGLEIYCKGRKLVTTSYLRSLANSNMQVNHPDLIFGTAPNIRASLPKGRFRDINSYYSIQNTFPEIYAVGADATVDNASDFQIAKSRQLKGYLTLIDQVLANQFSQLANIGALFSFKNAVSGTPSDLQYFYAVKDQYQKTIAEYPVPYLVFSPTYYYQSLYNIPHIRPLLKDNEIYNFSIAEESEKELEYASWIAYKKDPYNAYIKGLMDLMGDELTDLLRRNDMLDHLLARYGESPLLINAILNGSSYAGESLKDQVIFKSLYLQNLGLLSYYGQKAYNYLGADKVADQLTNVPVNFDLQIMGGYTNDFIFNSEKVDRVEKLTIADFTNYSTLELKLSLLFGLKTQYRDFITNNFELASCAHDLKLAMWMIKERKGFILIETGLLSSYTPIPAQGEQVILIFPAFIPQFNTIEFKDRLELFLKENMPVQVSYHCHFLSSSILEILIIAFADWHNEMIYHSDPTTTKNMVPNATSLMKIINQLNTGHYV